MNDKKLFKIVDNNGNEKEYEIYFLYWFFFKAYIRC